jgi:hypothetical protein
VKALTSWPSSSFEARKEEAEASQPKSSGISLVLRNAAFGRFWLARTASHIGDGASVIALLLYVKDLEHSDSRF